MRLVLIGDGESPHLLKWARALAALPEVDLWALSSRGFLPAIDTVLPDLLADQPALFVPLSLAVGFIAKAAISDALLNLFIALYEVGVVQEVVTFIRAEGDRAICTPLHGEAAADPEQV